MPHSPLASRLLPLVAEYARVEPAPSLLEINIVVPSVPHLGQNLLHDEDIPPELLQLYVQHARAASSALAMMPKVLRLVGDEMDKLNVGTRQGVEGQIAAGFVTRRCGFGVRIRSPLSALNKLTVASLGQAEDEVASIRTLPKSTRSEKAIMRGTAEHLRKLSEDTQTKSSRRSEQYFDPDLDDTSSDMVGQIQTRELGREETSHTGSDTSEDVLRETGEGHDGTHAGKTVEIDIGKLQKLEDHNAQLRSSIGESFSIIAKLKLQANEEKKQRQKAQREKDQESVLLDENSEEIKQLTDKLEQAKTQLSIQIESVRSLERKVAELENYGADQDSEIVEKNREIERLEKQKVKAEEEARELQERIIDKDKELGENSDQIRELRRDIQRYRYMTKTVPELKEELKVKAGSLGGEALPSTAKKAELVDACMNIWLEEERQGDTRGDNGAVEGNEG